MKKETAAQRAAWTALVDGPKPKKSKYGNVRTNGYASRREADVAVKLRALEQCGEITDLKQQVRIVLVGGRDNVRALSYVADFTYRDKEGALHTVDAKGFQTEVYKIKKKLAYLLHGITIEEM